MDTLWGALLILLTMVLCWLGQVVNAFWPKLAVRVGLSEKEADVDPCFYADSRGEALWDALTLWILPLAGVLLILGRPSWAYYGLMGGAIYVYFAGRGLLVRRELGRRGIKIGPPETVTLYNVVLAVWGLAGLVTIVMATRALPLH